MPHASEPAMIKFKLEEIEFETKFLVLSNLTIPILGMQFLRENEIVIINKKDQSSVIEVGHPNPIATIPCHSLNDSTIQPMESTQLKPGYNVMKFKPQCPENSIVYVSLIDKESPLRIFENVYQINKSEISVDLWNFASSNFYVSQQSPIIKIEPCTDSYINAFDCSYQTDQFGLPAKIDSENVELGEPSPTKNDFEPSETIEQPDQQDIDPKEWEKYLDPRGIDVDFDEIEQNDSTIYIKQLEKAGFPIDLLPKFIEKIEANVPNVFAKHALDAGTLDPNIMVIKDLELKPGAIVRTKPYKMDFVRRTQCDRILEKLEEYNIIRKGSSEYYSPVFIIAKSNNQLRMVTSYCSLNAVMKQVFYSIPDTKLVIQQIAETDNGQIYFFTQLDLSNAYSSIKIEGKAQEQFALATQTNTYLVQRLLFGAQCAPAYFNEAVKRVIAKCEPGQGKHIYSFFDDVTIVTKNDREFHLEKVLEAIIALGHAGFKFRADKCHYFKKQCDILGCRINRFGVMPMERHIKSIKQLKEPTNLQEAQKIQGLLNWHAHLLPMFSEKIKPITKLSQKDFPFEWGEEQQECLKWFQRHITSRIMTHFPDYSSEIYVCSDASKLAVGGIAYQIKTFNRKYLDLVDGLLVDHHELEEARKNPILPVSGKQCPKYFDLQGQDSKIKNLIKDAELIENSSRSQFVHLCCPVAYFSRSLSKPQQLYTTLEQETLGAVSTILQFQTLLLGFQERYFFSDCQPLLYLVKGATGGVLKFERWLQKLNQIPIHFTVIHVKGKFNFMADFLSRFYCFGLVSAPTSKLNRKQPVIIRSPFKPGQMVTIDDIKHAIRNDPGTVYNINSTEKIQTGPQKGEKMQTVIHIELLTEGVFHQTPKPVPKIFQIQEKIITPEESVPRCLTLMGHSIFKALEQELTWENIVKWQKKDQMVSEIIEKIDTFKQYVIKNGVVHRKQIKPNGDPKNPIIIFRILLPFQLLTCAIAYFHLQHHAGARSIFEILRNDYYYPNLFYKVQDFCGQCYLCMMFKARKMKNPIPQHPYYPIKKAAVWAMDIVQGFKPHNKFKSILTIVDLYSQFTILRPLRYETAGEIKTILMQTVFSCFPIPDLLISDNATNLLRSSKIRQLAYYYNVGLHLTSPYSSQSNGSVEIVNRKAKTLLAILVEQLDYPWPELTNFVMVCLNSKPLTSRANLTPYFIMYGRENNTFKPNFSLKEKELIGLPELIDQWSDEKGKIEKIIAKWHKRRDDVNKKKPSNPPNIYAKGEFVFVQDKRPKTKKKLEPRIYRTPMMILADYGATVLLKNSAGQIIKFHKNFIFRMKSFDKEAYDTLPTLVKLRIGFSYTAEELKNYFFEENEIPPIFTKFGDGPVDPDLNFDPESLDISDADKTFDISAGDIPKLTHPLFDDPNDSDAPPFDPNETIENLGPLSRYLTPDSKKEKESDSESDSDSEGEEFEKIVAAPEKRKRTIRFNLVQSPN